MSDERRYSLQDVCHLLNLNSRQLHHLMEIASIEAVVSARDARRKELVEAQVAQLRTFLDDEMGDSRRHELERRLALLERRVMWLERGEKVPFQAIQSEVVAESSSRPPRPSGGSSGLPEDWMSLNDACIRYGVNVNTAKTHVRLGNLSCHKGLWRSGMTRTEYALDPDEQLAFRAHFGVAS
jgi:hypothetical protein